MVHGIQHCGQELAAHHHAHGLCLHVQGLAVVLQQDGVAGAHLTLGEDVVGGEQADVLFRHHAGQGLRGGAQVVKPSSFRLGHPLVGVAVAVEDDLLVLFDGALDQLVHGGVHPVGGGVLQLVVELPQGLGHGGVQHHVGAGHRQRRAGHAELELVAGEGEGAGAVAVGGVFRELGQHVHAQVDLGGLGGHVLAVGGDGVQDGGQIVAHEHRHDGRGRLVAAQAVLVARRGDAHAKQVLILVHRADDGGEEDEELQVIHGGVAGVQQVHAGRAQRPVVVFAGAVDPLEGLFVQKAHKAVLRGQPAHEFHGQQVVVHRHVAAVEEGGQLVLGRGHLVVLGLGAHAQLPQLLVQLVHEGAHLRAQRAEVVLLQLLALGGRRAEEGAAGEDEVLTLLVVLLLDEEILLLQAHGHVHMGHVLAEQLQNAAGLVAHRLHAAQQGGLFVQGFARPAAKGGGDAQRAVLHKGVAGGVPGGVATGLGGGPQAAGGEAGSVRLAPHQLLAGKLHDGGAVLHGADEAVVLFAGDAGEGLEPVGVVGGALLDGPVPHEAGHHVGQFDVQGLALLQGGLQALVGGGGQPLLHHMLVEHQRAVHFLRIRMGHVWFLPAAARQKTYVRNYTARRRPMSTVFAALTPPGRDRI